MWKFAIFLIVIIGSAEAASLATAEYKEKNCTIADAFAGMACLFRLQNFMLDLINLEKNDKAAIEDFKQSCDSIQTCLGNLKCGPQQEERKKNTERLGLVCSSYVFIYDDFGECSTKLENKNSTCFQTWSAVKSVDLFQMEKREDVESWKKDVCTNVFGKDKCMKQEIVDECGEELWKGAEKNFSVLVNLSMDCYKNDS